MVIDHANSLHEGVADGGADEVEASFFERFAHGLGFGRLGGDFGHGLEVVLHGRAADELPQIIGEGAFCFEDIQVAARVFNGGIYF